MKKIKPIKPRLGHRIANAVKCLKGEPWPVALSFELPKIERHEIQAFGCQHVCRRHIDEWAPVDMDKVARERIALNLGRDLLQAGAIEITTEPANPAIHGPFPGTVYRAKVRVVMPAEKEAQE